MPPLSRPIEVLAAAPDRQVDVLAVLFHHLPDNDRRARIEQVRQLFEQGVLQREGLFVAAAGADLVGAMIAVALPGSAGMVWPPQALPGPSAAHVEDLLVQHAGRWLRGRRCKFGQALLTTQDSAFDPPLLRNGYRQITRLLYLQSPCVVSAPARTDKVAPALCYQPYAQCDRGLFQDVLLASYEKTLDCPELNEARSADEILEGYRGVPGCGPERWWLARNGHEAVGVLILADRRDGVTWELMYLGVAPAARGRGIGRAMTGQALREAAAAGAQSVHLTLDARNAPAERLYRCFGFEVFDRREVYLSFFAG